MKVFRVSDIDEDGEVITGSLFLEDITPWVKEDNHVECDWVYDKHGKEIIIAHSNRLFNSLTILRLGDVIISEKGKLSFLISPSDDLIERIIGTL